MLLRKAFEFNEIDAQWIEIRVRPLAARNGHLSAEVAASSP
jgi:hypothetical protein